MGLFKMFKSTRPGLNGHDKAQLGPTHEYGQLEIPEKIFIESENPKTGATNDIAKSEVKENNIDLLFQFLDKNFEEMGYNDALRNPDSSHMEQNVEALKNQLQRVLRKVKTYYEDFMKEADFHIESRSRNGMVDTVEELKMKKEIAESHFEKVNQIEMDAKNNTGDSQGIIISYMRGFKNGFAAISHHTILNRKF